MHNMQLFRNTPVNEIHHDDGKHHGTDRNITDDVVVLQGSGSGRLIDDETGDECGDAP